MLYALGKQVLVGQFANYDQRAIEKMPRCLEVLGALLEIAGNFRGHRISVTLAHAIERAQKRTDRECESGGRPANGQNTIALDTGQVRRSPASAKPFRWIGAEVYRALRIGVQMHRRRISERCETVEIPGCENSTREPIP